MNHTPGPWKASTHRPGDKEIKVSCDSGEWARLDCTVDADDCCVDTAIANAKLIAAAPELLAALEQMIGMARPVTIHETSKRHNAYATLQKARGEQ